MKTLLILRHGKSSWGDASLADHDRPLKKRGRRAARRIGRYLRENGLLPDRIITSTAVRARGTARRAAEAAGYEGELIETRALYLSGVDKQLATVARHARPGDSYVMIVGHNPVSEDLVEALTGEDVVLTTANLAAVDLAIDDWSHLLTARGDLRFVVRPRELVD